MSQPLKNFIHSIIPEEHLWKLELFKQWNAIIGKMKDKVIIEKIDGETLYLCASHPVWAQELHLLTPMIKERINACLPSNTIKTIRINRQKPKPILFKKLSANALSAKPEAIKPPVILTPQEMLLLAPLASNELQSSMGSYLIRCKKTTKKERG